MTTAINYDLIRKIDLVHVQKDFYTANYSGRVFSIGEILYTVLKLIQDGQSLDTVRTKISKRYEVFVDSEYISEQLAEFTSRIDTQQNRRITRHSYIYLKLKIFGRRKIDYITQFLSFLFNRYVVLIMFFIASLFSVLLGSVIYKDGIWGTNSTLLNTFFGLLITYLGVIIIGLLHEFGHASAATYYKQPSESIGFGFYLVFPVFYSEVTKIWNLPKWKRVVVNLGGVYFQLILNVLFYLFYVSTSSVEIKLIIKFFVNANLILLVYALNPFLRNDGYWVYSDMFDIPNLTHNALKFPAKLTKEIRETAGLRSAAKLVVDNMALMIYSFSFYIVLMGLVLALIYLAYQNIINAQDFILTMKYQDWMNYKFYKEAFSLAFGLFINFYFFYILISRLSTVKHKKSDSLSF